MATLTNTLEVPEKVTVTIKENIVTVKGPKGEVIKTLNLPTVTLKVEGNMIHVDTTIKRPNKNQKMYINTFASHIKNMIRGVQHPYKASLKVCSGHFPITVAVEGTSVVVKNFLGEKSPRKSTIMSGVKVVVQGDIITLEGADIDHVSQTAARIEQSTRITNRDRRIFQDGCYIIQKPGDEE